jgi:hypothetical protein
MGDQNQTGQVPAGGERRTKRVVTHARKPAEGLGSAAGRNSR